MGVAGSCLPRYGCCVPTTHPNACKENHTSTPHRRKAGAHRRNLSAAFNLADLEKDCNIELLNVNTATEEELMTLPGINRQTAHNIIEYRKQIGQFKKVEDLALVSGVGATKLTLLRLEICVKKPVKSSTTSSSTSSSRQDLSILDNVSRSSCKSAAALGQVPRVEQRLVSVNHANVFQLMKVKGISQQLAENIVMYREKKGNFRTVDELLKVKGIKPYLLSAVRQWLSTEEQPGEAPTATRTNTTSGAAGAGDWSQLNGSAKGEEPITISALSSSQDDLISLYGPLARKSYRGARKKHYFFRRNGRPVMRFATWNLQQCTEEKTRNPGVKEVFAMTALENGLGIIAVQELGDAEALQKLCDELNHPTIPNVKKFSGHRGIWKCVTSPPAGRMYQGSERLGFLYDASRGVELMSASLLENNTGSDPSNQQTAFTRRPFIGVFQVERFDVVLVNLHVKAGGLRGEDVHRSQAEVDSLPRLIDALDTHLQGEKDVILLGDFNMDPSKEDFAVLKQRGYQNAIPADKYTNISMRNPEGSKSYDNIWIGPHTNKVYTGTHDVVREGLTSPWIPDGWGWGGLASDHCPVWAELYTDGVGTNTAEDSQLEGSSTGDKSIAVRDIQVALKMGVLGSEL